MSSMFFGAILFDCDLSRWDVSRVKKMDNMFLGAERFKQKICGLKWLKSKASMDAMFDGTTLDLCTFVTTAAPPDPLSPQSRSALQIAVSKYFDELVSVYQCMRRYMHAFRQIGRQTCICTAYIHIL